MPPMRRHLLNVWVAQLAFLATVAGAAPAAEECRTVPDAELRSRFAAVASEAARSGREAAAERDGILCEVARRGGDGWATFLAAELKRPADNGAKPHRDVRDGVSLELLTTLRRIERQPDPLGVRLFVGRSKPLHSEFPSLPTIPVALVNQDVEELLVRIRHGGDYRTGRQARWRFEVRNAAGRLMPVRDQVSADMRGGLSHEAALAFDELWRTELEMSAFVPALPPGRYTVRVLYHDSLCISEIADAAEVAALVTSGSDEVPLIVSPRVVTLSNARDREVRQLLEQIELAGPVRIVAGTYGPWADKLVPADSAQGRLLSLGFQAVPPLLHALEDERVPPERRAIIFGLLFSLTGQNDPREESGVVGDCRYALGPWQVWGDGGGGMGFGGGGYSGGTIDKATQRKFIERWRGWKNHFRVVRPPNDAD